MNEPKVDRSVQAHLDVELGLRDLRGSLRLLIRSLQIQLDELIVLLRVLAGEDEVKWAVVAQAERLRRALNALPVFLDHGQSDLVELSADVERAGKAIAALQRAVRISQV